MSDAKYICPQPGHGKKYMHGDTLLCMECGGLVPQGSQEDAPPPAPLIAAPVPADLAFPPEDFIEQCRAIAGSVDFFRRLHDDGHQGAEKAKRYAEGTYSKILSMLSAQAQHPQGERTAPGPLEGLECFVRFNSLGQTIAVSMEQVNPHWVRMVEGEKLQGPASRPMKLEIHVEDWPGGTYAALHVQAGDRAGFDVAAPREIIHEAAERLLSFEGASKDGRGA